MKYSFLVPVYNKLENIKRCFTTLLQQTYNNFEIIIVDDNSNKETVNYLRNFAKNNTKIKLYFNESNLGIGQTRNILLNYATGDYVIFIDSDDYVENQLLEKINDTILKNSDLEIIRFQNIVEPATLNQMKIESKKNPFRFSCDSTKKIITGEEALMTWCLGTNKINTMPWTYCIKKELYSDVIYPNVPYLEDFAITHYLLAKASQVIAINYVGYHYLQYDSSLTKKEQNDIERILYDIDKLNVFNQIIQLTKYYINKTSILSENKRKFFDDIDERYNIREKKINNKLMNFSIKSEEFLLKKQLECNNRR